MVPKVVGFARGVSIFIFRDLQNPVGLVLWVFSVAERYVLVYCERILCRWIKAGYSDGGDRDGAGRVAHI